MLSLRQSRSRKSFVVEESSDIFVYEYGHIFSKERVINAIEISKEAYYYIYRKFPTNE